MLILFYQEQRTTLSTAQHKSEGYHETRSRQSYSASQCKLQDHDQVTRSITPEAINDRSLQFWAYNFLNCLDNNNYPRHNCVRMATH
mgnify:CR=1 FL=1